MKTVIVVLSVLIGAVNIARAEVVVPPVAVEGMEAAAEAVEVGNKKCPVSGGDVSSMGGPFKKTYKGKIYNLCCVGCEKDFDADPSTYAAKAEEEVSQ